MGTQQFSTFHLDGHFLGIEVVKVQEVIRSQRMTNVPLAPPEVRGLINLRGQIVTALDLRQRLDLPPREEGSPEPINVVVHTPEGSVSLLVDEIGDVLTVDDELFERPPDTVQGIARTLIRGAYKLDGHLLLVLDTEKTVTLSAA
jgi:purine-binding chemotaxis protein CheW